MSKDPSKNSSDDTLGTIRAKIIKMIERRLEILGIDDYSRVDLLEWAFDNPERFGGHVKAWSRSGGDYIFTLEVLRESGEEGTPRAPIRIDTSEESHDFVWSTPEEFDSILDYIERYTDTHFLIRARF